jgi:PiT family inorganic phosphate transporter
MFLKESGLSIMPEPFFLIVLVVIMALVFDYINGFHDTANAIATVVSTRVLSPRTAIIMAAVLNFVGALVAQNVAKTIASGLVDKQFVNQSVILAAIIGAIIWNLITWKFGIPSSSSHALIGGLCGAVIARGGFDALKLPGLKEKVLIPLVMSPIIGVICGFILMYAIYFIATKVKSNKAMMVFKPLQIMSSSLMAFSHGSNDAQKSMGIITLALVAGGFMPHSDKVIIPLWVMLSCAVVMALGTAAGGWRIIKTMGHKILRMEPPQGFAAETSASIVILIASKLGIPVSTTHVISSSIFGVGIAKNKNAVRWIVARDMIFAWILTIPASGLVSMILSYVFLGLK